MISALYFAEKYSVETHGNNLEVQNNVERVMLGKLQ